MTNKYINLTILLVNIYQSVLSESGDLLYYVSDTRVEGNRAFDSCNLASPPLVPDLDSYMLKINANNVVASQVVSTFDHKLWVGYYKVRVDFENVGCLYHPGQWNYTYTCKPGIECELWICSKLCDSNLVGFRRGNASCVAEVSFCKNSFCFCLRHNSDYEDHQQCLGRFYFAGVYKKVLNGTNENLNHSYGIITDEELNDKTINYEQGYVINTFADNTLMFDLQTAQLPSLCEHGTRHTTNLTTAGIPLTTTRADTSYAYGTSNTNIHTNQTGSKGTRHTTNLTTAGITLTTSRADTSYAYGTSNTNIHTNQTGSKDIGMYAGSVAGGVLLIAAIAGVCIWYKRRRGNDDRREKKSFELEDASDGVYENEIDSTRTEESSTQINTTLNQQHTYIL